MRSKAQTRRRPGRPRIHPTPVKLGIRFRPDLFKRMDAYLRKHQTVTQRGLIEDAVEHELDRLENPSEGAGHEHHSDTHTAGAASG